VTDRDAAALDPLWYDSIARRTSRRRFDGTPVAPEQCAALSELCARFTPFPGSRAVFVEHAPDGIFTGIVGSYGSVRGAPSAGVFIAREGADVGAGYVGEAFVLEATRLGLGTCWIAGMFDRKRAASVVELSGDERVVSVTPVGLPIVKPDTAERLMHGLVSADRRKDITKIAPSLATDEWPGWATIAVDAARLAPSGANRQPWRFRMQEGALVVYAAGETYWTAPLDFGIAMLHAQLGAAHAGVVGTWEFLEAPDVARFTPWPGSV
jgi:hypothetical protein